jgi:ABC-2 type transport system ATP-binding protein
MAILSASSLSHEFDGMPVLRDFDLEIESGDLFGLLGGPGTGKTTFLELVAAAYPPTGGTLLVAGLDIVEQPGDVRRLTSLAPRRIALAGHLTARENLLLFGNLHGLSGGALRQRANELLAALRLESRSRVPVRGLDEGARRCLNIAVSLVQQPRLALLDEPLAGLDPASASRLGELIASLPAAGITVLLATRAAAELEPLASRFGILSGGRLVAVGSHAALAQRLAHRSVVRIRTREPLRADLIEGLVGNVGYALEPHVFEVRVDPTDKAAALLSRFAGRLDAAGVHIVTAEIREPDLASIFAELAGQPHLGTGG